MTETTKIELEDTISRAIMAENGCTAHFEYANDEKGVKRFYSPNPRIITVMTYNTKTKETFLLQEVKANTDEEGLEKISEYVKGHKIDYDSYTIIWVKKGNSKQASSCFYCKDALEALEKFYFNKDREEYIIYSVTLSPKS